MPMAKVLPQADLKMFNSIKKKWYFPQAFL
jgi:hypothetical protein